MKNDIKKEWKLKVTPNVNAINDLCNDAQENSRYMAAIGKTGLGKTEALKQYAKKNANTYYMLCTITMGRKDFLSSLAEAIGLQVEGSIHHRVILRTLPGHVVAIDEIVVNAYRFSRAGKARVLVEKYIVKSGGNTFSARAAAARPGARNSSRTAASPGVSQRAA